MDGWCGVFAMGKFSLHFQNWKLSARCQLCRHKTKAMLPKSNNTVTVLRKHRSLLDCGLL